jgi:D-arginine dehydrogenase
MTPSIAVVGAGIVGCTVAQEVSRRAPGSTVFLFDRDTVGAGATRRSAGLHFPRGASERVRRMAAYSQDHYEALHRADPSLPIYPLGMIVLAAEAGAAELGITYLASARLTRLDATQRHAGSLTDVVRVPRGAGVWGGAGCHYADVHALTQHLAQKMRSRVLIEESVRVCALGPAERHVAVDLGTGRTLMADRVVLAPGPWLSPTAWRQLVAPLGLRVKKVVALHVARVPAQGDPAVVFQDEDAFLLPLHHRGHWLFSYTCQDWDVDPDELHDGLSAADLDAARDCLARFAPALVPEAASGRVFCDAYAPDRQPVIRTLDAAGRILFVGGANGSGYRLAPAMAAEAARLLSLPSDVQGKGALP